MAGKTVRPPDKNRKKSVIVAMPLGAASGRDRLTGVLKYINEGNGWSVSFVQDDTLFTPGMVHKAERDGVDGFIIGFVVTPQTQEALVQTHIPTVFTLTPDDGAQIPPNQVRVQVDNVRIGAEAAKHLKSIGTFRSYGYFLGYHRHYGWSHERQAGFRNELAKSRIVPSVLDAENESVDMKRIVKWIEGLAKPAAVLASCDFDGQLLLEACQIAGIDVPKQVALIGVENDEFICNCSRPTLSSIQPANREVGYRAAIELARLMRGEAGGTRIVIRNAVEKTVTRESSRTLPPAGHLIRDALAYIRENACKGVRASDVSRHLHVSRRLLDLRFSQIQKSSVLDAITEVRINEAKRRLEKTGDSMSEIAEACGYRSAARLSKAFHARTGLTPSAWRAGERRRVLQLSTNGN